MPLRILSLRLAASSHARSCANYIDTLAAAYAEAGQFSEAVRWQEKALEDAGIAKNAGSRRRLALYKEGKAFRE